MQNFRRCILDFRLEPLLGCGWGGRALLQLHIRGTAFLRKPDALKVQVEPRYVGYDIPNEFVVGYGLDYAEKYRNLRVVGTLAPHVYS